MLDKIYTFNKTRIDSSKNKPNIHNRNKNSNVLVMCPTSIHVSCLMAPSIRSGLDYLHTCICYDRHSHYSVVHKSLKKTLYPKQRIYDVFGLIYTVIRFIVKYMAVGVAQSNLVIYCNPLYYIFAQNNFIHGSYS